eukprot:Clim_evm7s100 gene=Clim_evmTU7s100
MSFKQIALTGLVAAVAANPAPSAREVVRTALEQRVMAIAGLDPVVFAFGSDSKRSGVYVGPQHGYEDENGKRCRKAVAVIEQAIACMLFKLDTTNNNELMVVQGNPKMLYGSIKSGDGNVWEFSDRYFNQTLDWYLPDSMDINEDNIFTFTIGNDDDSGFWPTIEVTKSFLDSTLSENTPFGRSPLYYFGPKKFDEEYSLLCGYAVSPMCE